MIAPTPWLWAVAVGLAFLLGSIPFSLLIGLVKGVDIRTVGSKNVGATNLGRALGGRYFALGFVCDMLKGLAPVLAVGMLFGLIGASDMTPAHAWAWLGVVAAAVLGHMFSPWVGFKGGKGVATGLGALLGVYPMLTVPALGGAVVFGVVFALWRRSAPRPRCRPSRSSSSASPNAPGRRGRSLAPIRLRSTPRRQRRSGPRPRAPSTACPSSCSRSRWRSW
jgi:acyl-phosphate glycerol 3-phosphate acyltransferase